MSSGPVARIVAMENVIVFTCYFGTSHFPKLPEAFITMDQTFLHKQKPEDDPTVLRGQRLDLEARCAEQELRKALHKEKEAAMREDKLTVVPFLKSNDVQRSRAEQQAKEERKRINELERQRCTLVHELTALRLRKARLDRSVQQHAVFAAYVKKVSQSVEQEPAQLMHSFGTLMHCANRLLQIMQHNLDCAQKARSEYALHHQQAADVILRGNNALGALQRDLDNVQSIRMNMEAQWSHILDTAAKKTLELGTIKMASLNLSQFVHNSKSGYPPVGQEDTVKQLEQVKTFITYSTDVLLAVKKTQEALKPRLPNEKEAKATV
ncbi:unnamed protein product [Gadus morhua 'NCC']